MKRAAYLGRLRKIFSFISLFAGGALAVAGTLAGLLLLGDRSELTPTVVDWSDPFPPAGGLPFAQSIACWLSLLSLILATIVWLLWIFSATRFAKASGAASLRNGPFSAVAMHFVPILAWAMPMVIMVQLEQGARDPAQWRSLASSRLAGTAWIIGKFSWVTFASGLNIEAEAGMPDQDTASLWFSLAGAIGCLTALYLFNRYLKHMEALQTALAARIDGASGEATA